MSLEQRLIDLVRSVVEELVAEGREPFRPGDVVGRLREQNQPMGTWEVRGALSRLEADGTIVLDPASASWRMTEARSRKAG